jgi:hypothetical protein
MVDAVEFDAAIQAKETDVEKLRRKLEAAEHELRGMKELRTRFFGRPSEKQPSIKSDSGKSGGRQLGAISFKWRLVLSDAYHDYSGKWFPESAIPALAERRGIQNVRPKDAKERLVSYHSHGYVEEHSVGDGLWRVTESAAKRFGFFEGKLSQDDDVKESAPNLEEVDAE